MQSCIALGTASRTWLALQAILHLQLLRIAWVPAEGQLRSRRHNKNETQLSPKIQTLGKRGDIERRP